MPPGAFDAGGGGPGAWVGEAEHIIAELIAHPIADAGVAGIRTRLVALLRVEVELAIGAGASDTRSRYADLSEEPALVWGDVESRFRPMPG